jgi:hypothetical protein
VASLIAVWIDDLTGYVVGAFDEIDDDGHVSNALSAILS